MVAKRGFLWVDAEVVAESRVQLTNVTGRDAASPAITRLHLKLSAGRRNGTQCLRPRCPTTPGRLLMGVT